MVLVKIKLLQKYIEILYDDDSNNFFKDVELINKNTSNLYLEILEELFESQGKYNQETFNQLWDRILSINKVDERSHYFYAKIKAFAIWKSLDEVYTFGDAFIAEEYHIKPDQIVDELPVATCHNERLDTIHKILQSALLPPVSHTWEKSLEPADFLLTLRKPLQTQKTKLNEAVRWHMDDLTLSDLWQYHKAGSTLTFSSLIGGLNNNWIYREIAEALTKLYWGFTRIIPANRLEHKLASLHKENTSKINETIRKALKDPLESVNKNIEAFLESSESTNSSNEDSDLAPWERVALNHDLMVKISFNPRIYRMLADSINTFLNALKAAIRKTYDFPTHGLDAADMMDAYMPPLNDLEKYVYNKNGKPYGKRAFQKAKDYEANKK